ASPSLFLSSIHGTQADSKAWSQVQVVAKGVVIEEPPAERRSKFRHDPSKRKLDSVHSGTPSKRDRSTLQSKGKSPMQSRYPKRKILQDSDSFDEDGSSSSADTSSSDTSQTPERFVEDRGALLLWPAEGGEVEAPSPSAA
ncbi:hypothetical protein Taro_001750, partial [Colocasia esculenta]|nr:hypothetical protein [Colocasia esculenta]